MASTGAKRMLQGRRLAWLLWAVCSGCAQMCGIEEAVLIDMSAGAGGEDGLAGGGSGGQDEQGGGAGADGTDASVRVVSCDEYCTKIGEVCQGDNEEYLTGTTEDGCSALCSHFSPEERRCRYEFIENATPTDALEECRVAGPGGQSPALPPGCGSLCENYCTLMAGECAVQPLTDAGVTAEDRAACLRVCNRLDPAFNGVYNTVVNGGIEPMGNNAQCRIFHIGNAASNGEALRRLHCGHAAGLSICK